MHEFKDKGQKIKDFKKILNKNCILGTSDMVPGILGNRLPHTLEDGVLADIEFDQPSKVWAHRIKLDGLEKIDEVFLAYLTKTVKGSGYTCNVISRKMTVTPSNSCYLRNQSQVSISLDMVRDKSGKASLKNPEQVLHIPNLAANKLTCLVFRVAYKVKYRMHNQADIDREFVLGRHPFFLNFDEVGSGIIKDRLVQFPLTMCPELTIINDLLWDAN